MAGTQRSAAELASGAIVLLVAAGFLAYAVPHTGRSTTTGNTFNAEFSNVGSITSGSDVRIAGVKVGAVTGVTVDPKTYQAVMSFTVQSDVKLPADSSVTISTGGLLAGAYVTLAPGGSDKMLQNGQTIQITQSAVNLEDLLGKFIFNVGSLADATQKSLQRGAAQPPPP